MGLGLQEYEKDVVARQTREELEGPKSEGQRVKTQESGV
jgi:hypothetical protein